MKEVRLTEMRAAADPAGDSGHVLEGMPIVYDMPTTIHDPAGDYIEIIRHGALDTADLSDVRLMYNHDTNKLPLARTPNTMRLSVVPAGMKITATLPDTEEARAVYEAVKRKDITNMSFAFTVPEGGDIYNPATNTRTITKIAKVYECSLVPFPAYPQTSIEARNELSASKKRLKAKHEAKILINQIKKVKV